MDEMSTCAMCGKPVPTSRYLDHLDGHRSEEMKNIRPGDWVRLLVNTGPFCTGDVGKVIEVNKGIYRRNKLLCEFDPNEKSVDRVRLDIHEHHCEPADAPIRGTQIGDWVRITAVNEYFSNFKVGDLAKVMRVCEGLEVDNSQVLRCDFSRNKKFAGSGVWYVTENHCEPADAPAPVETDNIQIRESPADESAHAVTIREKALKANGEKLADNFDGRLFEYLDRVGVREPPTDGSDDMLWENLWRVGPEEEKKPELTMADIRQDCFPSEYTWYGKQPEKIEVDPHPSEDWKAKLEAVMPKDDRVKTEEECQTGTFNIRLLSHLAGRENVMQGDKIRFQLLAHNQHTDEYVAHLDDYVGSYSEIAKKCLCYHRDHKLEPGSIWEIRTGDFMGEDEL